MNKKTACPAETTSSASASASEPLARMQRGGRIRLSVVDDGRLIGVPSLSDLLGSFELRREPVRILTRATRRA